MPASASPPQSPPVRTPGQQPSHPASATNRSRTPQDDRFALYKPAQPRPSVDSGLGYPLARSWLPSGPTLLAACTSTSPLTLSPVATNGLVERVPGAQLRLPIGMTPANRAPRSQVRATCSRTSPVTSLSSVLRRTGRTARTGATRSAILISVRAPTTAAPPKGAAPGTSEAASAARRRTHVLRSQAMPVTNTRRQGAQRNDGTDSAAFDLLRHQSAALRLFFQARSRRRSQNNTAAPPPAPAPARSPVHRRRPPRASLTSSSTIAAERRRGEEGVEGFQR